MQPHARRAERPRFFRGAREHRFAEAASDECLDEPEVRDLDVEPSSRAVELEEAGRLVADEAFPDRDRGRREVRRESFVGPRVAIAANATRRRPS